MTSNSINDIHSVGGSSYGALSLDEIKAALYLYKSYIAGPSAAYNAQSESLEDFGAKVGSSLRYHFSALADPSRTPKYASSFDSAHLVGGALSVQPLFGSFIVANVDNAETKGTFRADGKNSQMFSSSTATTLGSQYIDTANGYDMNLLSSDIPSSFFTPLKTWMYKLFPILTDRRLIYIAITEGVLVLLAEYLEDVNNDQSFQEQTEEVDLATIIQDNQEFENMILTGVFNQ